MKTEIDLHNAIYKLVYHNPKHIKL